MKNGKHFIKLITIYFLVFIAITLQAQTSEKTLKDSNYTYIPFIFEGETVDIIIYSAGNKFEASKKPLFLFLQGSLPRPLFFHDKNGIEYGEPFPFPVLPNLKDYHFVTIGKPGVPLIAGLEELTLSNYNYIDKKTGSFPRKYCQNNHLDYYVNRNKAVIDFLAKKDWVDERKIVVAGHSEGVSVALKMAIDKIQMSHLILLNAGVEGRIMAIITNHRKREKSIENYKETEEFFRYWESLVNTNPNELSDDCTERDSHKATASFSYPYRNHLADINLPVFFGYGTKDESVLLMDNLRVETIRLKKKNFHFKSYFGWEHNFFGFKEDGSIDYDDHNFDKVAIDFFTWLKTN